MVITSIAGQRLRALLSEPLLQFALVGLALFGINHLWNTGDGAPDRRIVIDAPLVSHQRQLYQVQYGAPPDALTMQTLLQRYSREEALYREGMRLRLDTGDEVIRQRIVQKMETLLADAEVVPEPTDAQLREFHARNAARYTEPGLVSFRQLYFAIGESGAGGAEARARAALARLQREPDARVAADALAIGESFTAMDAAEVARRFGDTPFSQAVTKAPPGQWAGPFPSGFGLHLLRVESRSAPRLLPLESVRPQVREDLLAAARDISREQRVADILSRYTIEHADAR